jgi:hypothetical protein
MPPAIARSRSSREPMTMSASPARIGATISGTSPGAYWLSAWTMTTMSAPSSSARA